MIQARNLRMYISWRLLTIGDYYLLTEEQIKSGNPRTPSQRSKKSSFKVFIMKLFKGN